MKDKSYLRFILFALGEAFLQYHFFKFLLKKIHAKRILESAGYCFLCRHWQPKA